MPDDIVICIVHLLDTASLLNVEIVCRSLQLLVQDAAYKASYGPGPIHRRKETINFRALAIEDAKFDDIMDPDCCTPDDQISKLHRYYVCDNECLSNLATDALLTLRRSSDRGTDAWNEAVAMAHMAQGRHQEAEAYYKQMMANGNPLPERTILTATRWSWPFTLPLPTVISQALLEQACIGAAVSGDTSSLMDMHKRGIPLDVVVGGMGPATGAARMGHVHVLQLLRVNNIDLM